MPESPEALLETALNAGTRADHYENLVRPRFMIAGATPAEPSRALAEFNAGACLLAGAREFLPAGERQRHQRVDDLARFIEGAEVQITGKSPVRRIAATMRGIFVFQPADIDWLLDNRRDFLRQTIPVGTDVLPVDRGLDWDLAAGFRRRFARAAVHTLACRRAVAPSAAGFSQSMARAEYQAARLEFLMESTACPPAIATLPDLAAWTLLRLWDRFPEQQVVKLALSAARDIRDRSIRMFLAHDQAGESRQRLEAGLKMVQRLIEKGPLKRRELVRGFADQRLELHQPVIDVLLNAGIIAEDADRLLRIGHVPVSNLTANQFITPPIGYDR